MKRRNIHITVRLDNSLQSKVDSIKAEGYGRLTEIIEKAIKNYRRRTDDSSHD